MRWGSEIARNALLATCLASPTSVILAQTARELETARSLPDAREVRLETTRDAWVSQVGPEADGNNGGAPRLKLKSIQEMSLIDVDVSAIRGRVIAAATLHVKVAGDLPLRRVTVGSIGAEWFEGTGSGYSREPGGATFRHRRRPDLPWSISGPGGDLCHVILGNGGTSWAMSEASPPNARSDAWQSIPLSPAVVAARVAGLSHGFLLFDDTGSEFDHEGERFDLRLFPNRFVYSRDQNRSSAPYLMVRLGEEDRQPPPAPTGLNSESRDMPPGEAIVTWVTPPDRGPAGTLGFTATMAGKPVPRELIPLAGKPGKAVEMHLRDLGLERASSVLLAVSAVDSAGNVGPAATATIRLLSKPAPPLPAPAGTGSRPGRETGATAALPRLGSGEVAVIDELVKVHPATGELIPAQPAGYLRANALWQAGSRTIALNAARNEIVAFQVLIQGRQLGRDADLRAELSLGGPGTAGSKVQASYGRYHLVPTVAGPLPDPIVPLGISGPSLPRATINTPPGKALGQSLHVELFVPHDMPAGPHRGTLTISSGRDRLALAVALRVWDFDLPDHLSFLPEMNAYGLPENERDYYRLAHRHRTVLNRLPYHQNGVVDDGCAPRWTGGGTGSVKRLDWTAWDRRFGPLLDGSAFADLPRKGVPVECFYLPLHENWPSPMEGNYNGGYWADEAFPESYRRAFAAASRQFAEHFQARGWNDTLFQGFLNNKNNFKANGWSRGSSPWLLDEPANFQDYWALRYFARAFHEGVNQARKSRPDQGEFPRMVFRADISRPQWRRDALDGLLDYHVVGSAMREYPRLVFDRKRRFGEIVVEYGGTNPIPASNLQPVAWCLDAWSLGADGVLPWQTIGTADSWKKADELSLFYPLPGSPGGPGVVPSIRLKAYRRGQQDVEYLMLWAHHRGVPRWAVARQVREVLKLSGTRQATETGGAEDAGRIDIAGLTLDDLSSLRLGLGEELSALHPAPVPRLVDFRTPPREP